MLPDLIRIGQDLWPSRRKYRIHQAITAPDGKMIKIEIGEAETIARQETERDINIRLNVNDPGRPKQVPHYNCWII